MHPQEHAELKARLADSHAQGTLESALDQLSGALKQQVSLAVICLFHMNTYATYICFLWCCAQLIKVLIVAPIHLPQGVEAADLSGRPKNLYGVSRKMLAKGYGVDQARF